MAVEKLKDVKCCGENPSVFRGIDVDGEMGIGIACEICQTKAANVDEDKAIEEFKKIAKKVKPKSADKPVTKKETKPMNNAIMIRNAQELANSFHNRESQLMELISPVLAEPSAMKRLINNNLRYVENAKLDKCWTSPEGQNSIVRAVEDAMIMGAELGKMGDIVPFGNTCQFIPSIEAFEFSLTNGNNAPFDEIKIECIHENDKVKCGRKDGDFFVDFEEIRFPRGKVVAVAAYGTTSSGVVIGEVYDTDRLMAKAEAHSTSYQYYIRDKRYAEQLRGEGKLSVENGREYFNKSIPKSGGGTWDKKVFLDELSNPYDGPDQPEMLRKSAGKSFFGKFIKVRNSEAAMNEVRTNKGMRDKAVDLASDQFEVVEEV